MIYIIDTRSSNLMSLVNALKYLNIKNEVTKDIKSLSNSEYIILPGVGSYNDLIQNLKKNFSINDLKKIISSGKKFLGICVGMQVLSTLGREFKITEGLDLIKGEVKKIETSFKLPHVGWNSVFFNYENQIMKNIESGTDFYFTHSFEYIPSDLNNILGETLYGKKITSIIRKDNIYGVQFHPEKSQEPGLQLLYNFYKL